MVRIIVAALGGLIVGATAAWFVSAHMDPGTPTSVVRDIVAVPKMSGDAAEDHRVSGYAALATVQQIQALPTPFARLDALYALAGRSGAGDVQSLLFEANRIADAVERQDMLVVLFYRLAELDPQSALALVRTDYFRGLKLLERIVWRAWARTDFEGALLAARTQNSAVDQNMAAQSLYAAFGYMGNDTTGRIEAELRVGPDRSTRARYLYELADRSPAEAVKFIESLPDGMERGEYLSWLAYYLSQVDPASTMAYADLFEDADLRKGFQNVTASNAARADPKATIDRILASGNIRDDQNEFFSAMRALASEDLDLALQYFQQAKSSQQQQWIGSIVVSEMVKKDPAEALAWARGNVRGDLMHLEISVLMEIARKDPHLAIAEAQRSSNVYRRDDLMSNVMGQIARDDPEKAVGFLELIKDRGHREQAAQHIASQWMRSDPDAALNWVLSNDDATTERLLMSATWSLVRTDVDAAMRILPRMNGPEQQNMRMQIAQQLATTRSPGEAQAFVRKFEYEPGFEHLQASVIEGIARSDRALARRMADQLADPLARDAAYSKIVGQFVQDDPRAAAAMLESMTDEHHLAVATGQVATQWYNIEPEAANRWAASLRAGPRRDDAIMHLAGSWRESGREQQAMIDSIGDDDKRGQAKLRQIYNVMHTDPERARKLLDDPEIPSHARRQIEMRLNNVGISY